MQRPSVSVKLNPYHTRSALCSDVKIGLLVLKRDFAFVQVLLHLVRRMKANEVGLSFIAAYRIFML